MKYFSMFSGVGGFELGIKKATEREENKKDSGTLQSDNKVGAIRQTRDSSDINKSNGRGRGTHTNGWKCIGYSEINKYAIKIYKKHFPKHKNWGNATKIDPRKLPDFNFLCAGFPCQSFSIAGKRKGFEDTRGTLFFEICRIVAIKRPSLLLLENVKGLLSHDEGQTFGVILKSLDELGYDVEWQVLNSKYFGVPQNRERVFIIGHLRGESRRQVFPLRESSEIGNEQNKKLPEQVSNTLRTNYSTGYSNETYVGERIEIKPVIKAGFQKTVYSKEGISPTVREGHGDVIRIADFRNDEGLRVREENISPNLTARRHSESDVSTMPPLMIHRGTLRRGEWGDGIKKNMSFTLDGSSGRDLTINGIRRLTPVECERLQGFPDNWTKYSFKNEEISDTQRYKCLGNAVTVNVIEAIIRKMQSIKA